MNNKISFQGIKPDENRADTGLLITLLISSIYVAIHFSICVYRYYTLQYIDWDFSLYANAMWNLIHGGSDITIMGGHFLGNHFTPIAYAITPIYFIFRSPLTLLFLQTLSLALVSVPVYLVAKRKFDWRIATCFVVLYFLYPPLLYVNIYEFHFEAFAPFFLAFAFYFLIANKKAPLFAAAALAMLCKENVPAVVAAMGLYALIFRPRRRLLGLILFCIGAAYFLLVTLYLHKLFTPGEGSTYAGLYHKYGEGFGSIFIFILTHPVTIIKDLFSTELKQQFFEHVFSPFLYLPLLRPDILIITAPTILKNLLSHNPLTHTIFWHYTATIIPFVVFSTIFALKKLTFFGLVKRNLVFILAGLMIVEVIQGYMFWPKRHEMVRFCLAETPENNAKIEAVKMIPKDAAVMATFSFLPKLSQRKNVYTPYTLWMWGKDKIYPPAEYALIDFNDHFIKRDIIFKPEKVSEVVREYTLGDEWNALFARGDIVLFKKEREPVKKILKLMDPADHTFQEDIYLTIDDSFELADIDLDDKIANGLIHLTFYWRIKNPTESVYQIYFFENDGISDRVFQQHSLGYRFYTPDLGENMLLREDYWLPFPEDLKHKKYVLTMDLYNITKRKRAKMEGSSLSRLDNRGKFILIYYDNR